MKSALITLLLAFLPVQEQEVKSYPFNTLVKVTKEVGDGKVFFRVVSPEDLVYDLEVRDGTLTFYAAMPEEGIELIYGVAGEAQLTIPAVLSLPCEGGPGPKPLTELEKRIEALEPTADEASALAAAFNQALAASTDTETLFLKAFTNLRPVVQASKERWAPFLTWLQADFEASNNTFEQNKARLKEIIDAFTR